MTDTATPSNAPDPAEQASRVVGQRLRIIRRNQGMSLADVEARSDGQWSASAVGAYERGFRNLSLPRLKALADFYDVPVGVLLGDPDAPMSGASRGVVFDLERLRAVMPGSSLERFTDAIIAARGDFNGRVLSIRADDLQAVCAMVGGDPTTALGQLREARVLITAATEVVSDHTPPIDT